MPRSCPARTTPSAIPATGTAGISACFHCRSSGSLRVRTAPSQTASASLIASDGWRGEARRCRPSSGCRRRRTPSRARTPVSWKTIGERRARARRTAWKKRTGIRDSTSRIGSPMSANFAWSRNTAYGEPLVVERLDARAGQDHDEPDDEQERGRADEHVVAGDRAVPLPEQRAGGGAGSADRARRGGAVRRGHRSGSLPRVTRPHRAHARRRRTPRLGRRTT